MDEYLLVAIIGIVAPVVPPRARSERDTSMKRLSAAITMLVSLLFLCVSAHAVHYQRIDLSMPGATNSYAYGVNDKGQVVGAASLSDGSTRAFLWQDGVAQFLTTLGDPNSAAFGINSSGQIVGYSYSLSTFSDSTCPLLWHNEAITDLGTPFGTTGGALRINSGGQVVGYSYSPDSQLLATLWQDGSITHLATLGVVGVGNAINTSGHVAGFTYYPNLSRRATLWRDGGIVDVGTLGGVNSQAQGINTAGWVCGYSDTADGSRRGFLWRSSVIEGLSTLGGPNSAAYDINTAGQIVGSSDTSDGSSHATLWQSGQVVDLGTGNGTSSEARSISDNGWICGYWQTGAGASQAAVWKPVMTFAITNRAAYDHIMSSAMQQFRFKVWGRVTTLGTDSFILDDGSKRPIRVVAPGYAGISVDDYATAVGSFSGEGTERVLNADASDVVKLQ